MGLDVDAFLVWGVPPKEDKEHDIAVKADQNALGALGPVQFQSYGWEPQALMLVVKASTHRASDGRRLIPYAEMEYMPGWKGQLDRAIRQLDMKESDFEEPGWYLLVRCW